MKDLWFHVLDLETTGFDSQSDQIAELCLITVKNTTIEDIHHHFFKIDSIHPKASEINGLTLEKLRGWESLEECLKELKSVIKYPIFAHNSDFERRFMVNKGLVEEDHPFIDTLAEVKQNPIGTENNKLTTLLAHYNIPHRPHTALSDTFGLYKLIILKGWQLKVGDLLCY